MPAGLIAYKDAHSATAEPLDLDERLWDHIRVATSFVECQQSSTTPDRTASAVVVRSAGGEPVVVVLLDRQRPIQPSLDDLCARYNLTRREREVAPLLADGLSCREIAERLHVSFSTARTHTERIMQKLGIRRKRDVRGCLGLPQ